MYVDTAAYSSVNNSFIITMIIAIKSQLMDYARNDVFILPVTVFYVPWSIV